MFLKTSSRYKLNKFVSLVPTDKVSYAPDVTAADRSKLVAELDKMMRNKRITIIVMENHTPKSIL